MKKRKLNRKGKLLLIFITILLIMLLYKQITKHSEQNDTTSIITQVNAKTSENTPIEEKTPRHIREKFCSLEFIECNFEDEEIEYVKELSLRYDIDFKLVESIILHETGHRTSKAYKELNNPCGNMSQSTGKLIKYKTIEKGYEACVKNLKNNYIKKGLTTIEQIQKKYAPLNVENDPNNLNSNWTSGVEAIYESLS